MGPDGLIAANQTILCLLPAENQDSLHAFPPIRVKVFSFPPKSNLLPKNPRKRSSNSNSACLYFPRKSHMISPSLIRPLQLNSRFSLFLSPNRRIPLIGSSKPRRLWKHSMSSRPNPVITDGVLSINGKETLKGVPENVIVTPSANASAFLGAVSAERSCRQIFKLGVLE